MRVTEWLGFATPPRFEDSKRLGRALGILLSVLGVLAVVLLIGVLWRSFELIFMADAAARDARGLLYFLVAIIGFPVLIWRTQVAASQAKTAAAGLVTERFTRAVEQLGASRTIDEGGETKTEPNLEVRLGGLYALERLARDELDMHVTIMEVLCAYIRENAPITQKKPLPEPPEYPYDDKKWREWKSSLDAAVATISSPRVDIQAALTVIGRRTPAQIAREWGSAEEKPAYRLDFREADLSKCTLHNAHLDYADFSGARLQDARLSHTELKGALFSFADMQCAQISDTSLQEAYFTLAKMQKADLYDVNLTKADAKYADMRGIIIRESEITGASFLEAKLIRAFLPELVFKDVKLSDALFTGARVLSSDFSDAIDMDQTQIEDMRGSVNAKFPADLQAPKWQQG